MHENKRSGYLNPLFEAGLEFQKILEEPDIVNRLQDIINKTL